MPTGTKTNYLNTALLKHLFRNVTYTPPANWQLSLHVVPTWQASTAYSVGQFVIPSAFNGAGPTRVYRCTTAGTSGTTEPNWPDTDGATVNDGTVVWTEAWPAFKAGTLPPEVGSGLGYSRVTLANGAGFTDPTQANDNVSMQLTNAQQASFGTATGTWGQVAVVVLWDGTNAAWVGLVVPAGVIGAGVTVAYQQGKLIVREA